MFDVYNITPTDTSQENFKESIYYFYQLIFQKLDSWLRKFIYM